jgi:predicted DNA-binding transcriptional regulator AlpA
MEMQETQDSQTLCRSRGLKHHHTMSRSLNTAEAAEMLGVAPATLRDWKCQRTGPPFIQISARCVRYSEADIHQYAADRRVVPTVRSVGRFKR